MLLNKLIYFFKKVDIKNVDIILNILYNIIILIDAHYI